MLFICCPLLEENKQSAAGRPGTQLDFQVQHFPGNLLTADLSQCKAIPWSFAVSIDSKIYFPCASINLGITRGTKRKWGSLLWHSGAVCRAQPVLSVTVSTAGLSSHPSATSYSMCAAGHTTELAVIPNRSHSAVGTRPWVERITGQLQAGTTANATFMSLHLRGTVGNEQCWHEVCLAVQKSSKAWVRSRYEKFK